MPLAIAAAAIGGGLLLGRLFRKRAATVGSAAAVAAPAPVYAGALASSPVVRAPAMVAQPPDEPPTPMQPSGPAVGSYANTPEQGYQGGTYPERTPGRFHFLDPRPAGHPEARADEYGSYWYWRWDVDPAHPGKIKGEN